MSTLPPTPGQTIGPFFHFALPFDLDRELVARQQPHAVRLHGYVRDGEGNGLQDAMIEIRQADATGDVPRVPGSMRRDGATFTGWGRSSTDPTGHYWFSTLEPGPTAADRAPFFAVTVFARGLLNRLFTRIYLPDPDPTDPFLAGLGAAERDSMIAVREADGSLRFDITLQGPDQTVFLTYPRHAE